MDDKARAQRVVDSNLVGRIVIATRPQDWAQPARHILWPHLAHLAQRERRGDGS